MQPHVRRCQMKCKILVVVCFSCMKYQINIRYRAAEIMKLGHATTMASQITSLTVVYSTVCSDADQRKHQSSASPAFVWGIHRGPVNSPHKWPVTRKMFPFDDVVMFSSPDVIILPWRVAIKLWNLPADALKSVTSHNPRKFYTAQFMKIAFNEALNTMIL